MPGEGVREREKSFFGGEVPQVINCLNQFMYFSQGDLPASLLVFVSGGRVGRIAGEEG